MDKILDALPEQGLEYEDMMELCRSETRLRVSEIIQLCAPFMDTPEGRVLMEEQLYSLLIKMLTYMQVNTRRLRKERQREGIQNALANGVHFGRKRRFNAEEHIDTLKRLKNGEIDKNTARAEIGASPNTFARLQAEATAKGLL